MRGDDIACPTHGRLGRWLAVTAAGQVVAQWDEVTGVSLAPGTPHPFELLQAYDGARRELARGRFHR